MLPNRESLTYRMLLSLSVEALHAGDIKAGRLYRFRVEDMNSEAPTLAEVMPYFTESLNATLGKGARVETIFLGAHASKDDPLGAYGYVGFRIRELKA